MRSKKCSVSGVQCSVFGEQWTVIFFGLIMLMAGCSEKKEEKVEVSRVVTNGAVEAKIATTGTVEPQNRLEVKPAISGRLEEILVKEGDIVKSGQIVAWMSSAERASLLDAAKAAGEKEMEYWKDAYKPAPLIAPIGGEVIVRNIEPGQSISPSSAVIVISDRLIVKARVDEVDVGKVRTGMVAEVALDAYPDVQVTGRVDHISYESKVQNNVTIYELDILPDRIPGVFRSGMNANIKILCEKKTNVVMVAEDFVDKSDKGSFVSVKTGGKTERRNVITGLSDGKNIEIVSGVAAGESVVSKRAAYAPGDMKMPGSNPFLPVPPKKEREKGKSK